MTATMTYSGYDFYTSGVQHKTGLAPPGGPAVAARAARHQREYQRKLQTYEKEFNINLTRIACREKELKDSMLAYSQHARHVANARYSDTTVSAPTLHVSPKHISRGEALPKLPKRKPKRSQPEAAALVNDNEHAQDHIKSKRVQRRHTVPPVTVSHSTGSKEELKVNLASASDLRDMDVAGATSTDSLLQSWDTSGAATVTPTVTRTTFKLKSNPEMATRRSTHAPSDRKDSTAGTIGAHGTDNETEARMRSEEQTRQLLRDAIRSLKLLEQKKLDPLAAIPRLRRSRRLKLEPCSLDAIPESDQEHDVTSGDKSMTSVPSPRRLPSLHSTNQLTRSSSKSSLEDIPEVEFENAPTHRQTPRVLPPAGSSELPRHVHWGRNDASDMGARQSQTQISGRLRARARQKLHGPRKIKYLRP